MQQETPLTRHGIAAAAVMMGWLTLVLLVDSHGSLTAQRAMGAATWVVLWLSLRAAAPVVRVQALVVVAVATVVEYTFSPGLEVYVYRFDNVPAYVPPGHGLVYLSAFALGHHPWVQERLRPLALLAVAGLGTWVVASYVGDRPDALGAFWFLCLLAFLRWGPSPEVYVGAAAVVTWLELVGTRMGAWAWQPEDPLLGISIGNPPSGAAGGYGWFDLVALLLAPWLLARWQRIRRRQRGGSSGRRRDVMSKTVPLRPSA